MKTREINILKIIINENYVDTSILVSNMNLSTRTIRYSINNIKSFLKSYDCDLLYSRQQGYYFSKAHQIKVELLISKLDFNNLHISNYIQRRNYILGKLLFNQKICISNICETCFCQKSTVANDIKYLNNCALKYSIYITKNKNYIYCNNLDFEKSSVILINKIIELTYSQNDTNISEVSFLFLEIFNINEFNYFISYIKHTNLTTYNKKIQVQILWYSYYIFKLFIDDIKLLNTYYYNILDFFKTKLDLNSYRTSRKIMNSLGYYKKLPINENVKNTIINFFTIISNNYDIKIDFESFDFLNLLKRIKEVELRQQLNIKIKLNSTGRIIRLFPYSFSLSQQLLGFVYKNIQFVRDDVAYITEKMQPLIFESRKSKALLIVTSSQSQAIDYCKRWINYQYTKNLKIFELNYADSIALLKSNTTAIKLILNFEEQRLNYNITELQMNSLLDIEQIQQIDFILKKSLSNAEFLKDFFIQNCFKIFFNSISIETVVENAINKLYSNNYIDNKKIIYDKIFQREKVSPTYIGYNTIILHPINYYSSKNIAFLTISKEPLFVNKNCCQIIFLCCFKKNIEFEISRFFEYILKIVENDKYRNKLLDSQSEMELIMNLNFIIDMF